MKLKIFEPHIKLELLSFTLTSATPFITCNYMTVILFLVYCYSFCKIILKYLPRRARVSLSMIAERSMFLPVRTVSDASGLCKCSIKVQFVVWELTVNNNNDDLLIHFLQRKILSLQMHRLLEHLDTCIYFCL